MVTRFGDFALDTGTRQLTTQAGVPVHVTPKAFALLVLLVTNAPRVVSKAEIHAHLWTGTFVSDATLVGLVKELRRAVCDVNRETPVIRTVHGVGYAFGARVSDASPRTSTAQWLAFDDRRVMLQPGVNLVGRDPAAEVWINATCVSRRHARILIGPDVVVEDLGSKNGTTAQGAPVTGRTAVQDGDRLAFGWVCCVYRSSGAGVSTETHTSPGQHSAESDQSSDG